ncbi:hypothetical protein TNCV_1090791 [Trichonephila clavipes]|uniref:Uncharacterized protein n=1 Tax=Trichonephila clavipes TaxID=2585209 RepID=A0A8X6ST78_TRICX|nr:hypothetical protein TNCV_1090791 [Trichonephila clavipes]
MTSSVGLYPVRRSRGGTWRFFSTHDMCDLSPSITRIFRGRGSLEVKASDRGWRVMSSSPVPLKTRRIEKRCTFHLSRAQTSSRWCGVVVRRGGASSGVVLVT